MPSVGESLRAYRRQAGVTGSELARRVGRSQSWVSRMEHDRVAPSVPEVERLAKALDLTSEQTAELVKLAGEAKLTLSAHERDALIQRVETLLGLVVEEVRRLR
jgi:transcriptional regulator with XRE-family HTH domain